MMIKLIKDIITKSRVKMLNFHLIPGISTIDKKKEIIFYLLLHNICIERQGRAGDDHRQPHIVPALLLSFQSKGISLSLKKKK